MIDDCLKMLILGLCFCFLRLRLAVCGRVCRPCRLKLPSTPRELGEQCRYHLAQIEIAFPYTISADLQINLHIFLFTWGLLGCIACCARRI